MTNLHLADTPLDHVQFSAVMLFSMDAKNKAAYNTTVHEELYNGVVNAPALVENRHYPNGVLKSALFSVGCAKAGAEINTAVHHDLYDTQLLAVAQAGLSGGKQAQAPSTGLTVDPGRLVATLDGKRIHVDSELALRWVAVLLRKPGLFISGTEAAQMDRDLDGARIDRLKKALPAQISNLIESRPGRGSRIRIDVA